MTQAIGFSSDLLLVISVFLFCMIVGLICLLLCDEALPLSTFFSTMVINSLYMGFHVRSSL